MSPRHTGERRHRFVELLVQLLPGHDLDVPAHELRRQPHVLPAPADRQRQLISSTSTITRPSIGQRMTSSTSAGCRAFGTSTCSESFQRTMSIRSPGEFVDNVLDARTAHTDARADGVDLLIDTGNGHFRAVTRPRGPATGSRSRGRRSPGISCSNSRCTRVRLRPRRK